MENAVVTHWYDTAAYRAVGMNRHGGVDLEIEHPSFGWIPFTVGDDDAGQAVSARLSEDGVTPSPHTPPPPTSSDVNAERDRRIAAGFEFGGHTYDFDIKAKTNISGAAQMAFMALIAGAQPGNLRWHGGNEDFSWITQGNQLVAMDAHTVVAFGKTAAGHESAYIHAARTLKNMTPIPENFAEDAYWP